MFGFGLTAVYVKLMNMSARVKYSSGIGLTQRKDRQHDLILLAMHNRQQLAVDNYARFRRKS